MPYKGGVQLLPETKRQVVQRSVAGNKWIFWGLGITGVVLAITIIFSSYIQNLSERIAVQDGMLRTQEGSRDKDAERELKAVQKQSKLMAQLLGNHVYWSQAFDLIGSLMQSGVSFTSIAAEAEKGTIEFAATAPNYTSVARQIASFNAGDGVLDIVVNSVQLKEGVAEFNGTITIDTAEVLTKSETVESP
jgi:hypothetical protein